MNFPFFIARRYLFSKKSTHAINIISAISAIGVAVATMALVIVLSVFNGFHDLVATLFTSFDPQLELVPTKGKTAPCDDPILTKIRQLPQVDVATECVEDQALAVYQDRQAMVTIKGVDDNFSDQSHITDILYGDGTFSLHAANLEYGTLGIRLAQTLGIGAQWDGFLKIYAPMKEGQLDMSNPSEGFVVDSLVCPGVLFAVKQARYDKSYILTSVTFARNLFGQQGMLSSLELRLKDGSDLDAVKKEMQQIAGDKYRVLDRFEQQEDTFIDKKDDVLTLRNLGASDKQIARVFLFEGRMISAIGAIIGIGIGLLLCLLQQEFGFVKLGDSAGSFIVDAYPVSVHYSDVAIIFVTVLAVGWLAVWYPVTQPLLFSILILFSISFLLKSVHLLMGGLQLLREGLER